jgi:hypothetical protein
VSPLKLRVRSLIAVAIAAAALLAVASMGCGRQQPTAPQSSGTDLSISRSADLDRVMAVQNRHTGELLGLADVIGTGTGVGRDGRPTVLVLTRHGGVAALPAQLEGVSVQEYVVGDVQAYRNPHGEAKPGGGGTLQCGTSTGNDLECSAGTIGCVVVKGGVQYFLSNNHVFARENAASIGERIDAPGRYDGRPKCAQTQQSANLSDFQAISFSGNNTIDCAIAQPVAGRAYTCAEAGGYTPSSTVVAPSVNLAVKKTGRTSGLTHGTISGINVTIQVQYSSGIATFVNQIMVGGTFIRSGDSGSLMVTESGNNPVGLCFAGGSGASFANPIGPVLQRFNATVCSQ